MMCQRRAEMVEDWKELDLAENKRTSIVVGTCGFLCHFQGIMMMLSCRWIPLFFALDMVFPLDPQEAQQGSDTSANLILQKCTLDILSIYTCNIGRS